MIQGIILDLDGTIYRGSQAVPGAAEFVGRLAEHGIKVLFVTNRANLTPESVCTQLRGYGISCTTENILTSAQATARHLRDGSVFFIGEEGLEQALLEGGAHRGLTKPGLRGGRVRSRRQLHEDRKGQPPDPGRGPFHRHQPGQGRERRWGHLPGKRRHRGGHCRCLGRKPRRGRQTRTGDHRHRA